jgi:cell division protein FtsB
MSALPMRRIDAPRRRPPGSRQARSERLSRFDRRRPRLPLQRRDGYAGLAEAAAELEQVSELRVVAPRRRLAANFAALALVLLGILMLSAVVLHTRLAERQRQIDQLEQQVDVQHDLFDVLRQQRAVLRSPTRLASESSRLGMFAPPESNFVAVDPWALAQIVASTGSTGSLDDLLVDDDALGQVRRVRAAAPS